MTLILYFLRVTQNIDKQMQKPWKTTLNGYDFLVKLSKKTSNTLPRDFRGASEALPRRPRGAPKRSPDVQKNDSRTSQENLPSNMSKYVMRFSEEAPTQFFCIVSFPFLWDWKKKNYLATRTGSTPDTLRLYLALRFVNRFLKI